MFVVYDTEKPPGRHQPLDHRGQEPRGTVRRLQGSSRPNPSGIARLQTLVALPSNPDILRFAGMAERNRFNF